DRWYYVDIQRHECQTQRSPQKITTDPCIDCTGTVDSISKNPSGQICLTTQVDLTANVSGDTTGWTYTWYQGSGTGGSVLGTGQTLNNYTVPSFPSTVTVGYTKSGCPSGNK